MRYHRYEAAILGVPLCLVLSGCFGPRPETMTLKQAARLVLYEGLPHQMYEHQALEAEKKAKPTVTLHGFPVLSRDPRTEARRRRALKDLLGDPASFEPYSGEKRCGGFHPDYAVEWSAGGQTYQALICLGCWEIKIYGPKGETIYDIRNDAREPAQAVARALPQEPAAVQTEDILTAPLGASIFGPSGDSSLGAARNFSCPPAEFSVNWPQAT